MVPPPPPHAATTVRTYVYVPVHIFFLVVWVEKTSWYSQQDVNSFPPVWTTRYTNMIPISIVFCRQINVFSATAAAVVGTGTDWLIIILYVFVRDYEYYFFFLRRLLLLLIEKLRYIFKAQGYRMKTQDGHWVYC